MNAVAATMNLAIVGLSVRNMHDLRQRILKSSPAGISYNWVSVTDPALNLLLINQDFVSTPSIQRIIQQKNLPVLQVCRQAHDHEPMRLCPDDGGILASQCGPEEDSLLQLWLKQNIRQASNPVSIQPTQPQSMDQTPVVTSMPSAASPAADIEPEWTLEFFSTFLQHDSAVRKLINRQGMVGLVDSQNHLFWPALEAIDSSRIREGMTLTYATGADRSRVHGKPEDLHQWLWQMIWSQTGRERLSVPNQPVKLMGWPQPAMRSVWKEVMSMSAALHRRPMRVDQLAQALQLPHDQAERFVFSVLASGLARHLSTEEQIRQTAVAPALQNSVTENKGGVRNFFSRLRNKLGI